MSRENENFIELRDFGIGATLLALAILSIIIPIRSWKTVTGRLARLINRLPGHGLRQVSEHERLAPFHPALRDEDNLGVQIAQMYLESRMQITDQYLLKKWKPQINCSGIGQIRTAIDAASGAILWNTPFAYSDLGAGRHLCKPLKPARTWFLKIDYWHGYTK